MAWTVSFLDDRVEAEMEEQPGTSAPGSIA
jgi:hypothetical protein